MEPLSHPPPPPSPPMQTHIHNGGYYLEPLRADFEFLGWLRQSLSVLIARRVLFRSPWCQAVALWVPRSYLLLDARLSYKLCAALTRHSNAIFATQLTNERIGRTGRSRITAAGKT